MILRSYSNKNFKTMFKQSMRQSCVLPAIVSLIGLIYAIAEFGDRFYSVHYIGGDEKYFASPRFFDFLPDVQEVSVVFIIAAAVVNAIILFSYQWSKKQCNVIYSIGMKREKIYLAKMAGGIVPVVGTAIFVSAMEIFVQLGLHLNLDAKYWAYVLYIVLTYLTIYIVAFSLCSVVFINTGNIIEGTFFSAIIAPFTILLSAFFDICWNGYTLGATNGSLENVWKWSNPFYMSRNLSQIANVYRGSSYYYGDFSYGDSYLSFIDFSQIITSVVFTSLIIFIGYKTIKTHKNETAGTWGRSKGATELAGVALGFYTFVLVLNVISPEIPGNSNFIDFLISCVVFFAVTIIFKLIFSSKRKEAVKKSVRRFPAYAVCVGAVVLVFSLGFFGYSSRIPKVGNIEKVELFSTLYKGKDTEIARESVYGLKESCMVDYEWVPSESVIFTDSEEINEIVKYHKAIIDDGKIKNRSKTACGNPIEIVYTLKNGKKISRMYMESTTQTAKKMFLVNDLSTVKYKLEKNLSYLLEDKTADSLLSDYLGYPVVVDVELSVYKVVEEDSYDYIGSIQYDYDGIPYLSLSDSNKKEYIAGLENLDIAASDRWGRLPYENCYIYPKDMTKGYNIGVADSELLEALVKDINNQSATEYFFHGADSELGVLSFGLSYTKIIYEYDGGVSVSYEEYGDDYDDTDVTDDTDEVSVPIGQYAENISWNIMSSDIKAIVVTKDMVNTVKYLEEHDLMKYFENTRNAGSVKAVKLATPTELYRAGSNTYNLPLFVAGYWDGATVRQYDNDTYYSTQRHWFNKINNQITDASKIKKLMESSVLFGFCDNDYRIMEIEYSDGSIATTLIPVEAYNEIMK